MSWRTGLAIASIAVGSVVWLGCGSSKPEYCSKTDDLQQALSTMKDDVTAGKVSAIQPDVQTVRKDVDAVVSSARSDFPSQTKALDSSISKLTAAVEALPSSPSVSDVVQLAGDVGAVTTAVREFKTATSSKCD
jgi:outer membrane murein-binding lipoprotein Lpp